MSTALQPASDGRDVKTGRFLPGNSGFGGRPKGARSKLGEQFLSDLQSDWQANGKEAIEKVREKRPHEYLKVIASILPKELTVKIDPIEELTDEQLEHSVRLLADALGLAPGSGPVIEGEAKAAEPEQAQELQPLP